MASMLVKLLLLLLLQGLASRFVSSNSEGDSLHSWRLTLIDPANVLQSWDPTLVNPCTWLHITCNPYNAVIRVDLDNASLSGSLVPDLGNLKYLQYLEVFGNQLSGEIPAELGKLKDLVSLDLYSNKLTGHIPNSFGKLKALEFLRLNNNHLSGPIPRELTALKKLRVLDLSSNDLCGTIPSYGGLKDFTPISFQNNPRLSWNGSGSCS